MVLVSDRWLVQAGSAVDLSRIDSASTEGVKGRDDAERTVEALVAELREFQERLWAEAKSSLLVVLQGMDTSGKDGAITHVFGAMNPQGVRVTSFKAPSKVELAHDFLWRLHQVVPAAGEVGIFNRSHYEDVVTVRVLELVPERVWRPRFDIINDFEASLRHGGTIVIKLFFHISKDEQRRRLEDRVREPEKRWKFNPGDMEQRARWNDYMTAYADAIERTSRAEAPWYVIPSDHKWYRNFAVSNVLVETLREMGPRYPDRPEVASVQIT